ncbi:hypothetical protein HDF25_000546 [Pedobacter cryoconitis]|uniref:Uncharacterized protein n=1 Tax=Pedobacter cryoconitis TaxID=188932 RepID=A0A7X0MGK9_9SPHI|nr:hypothetical protein [Pedobacter cryoconitis]
MNEEHPSNLLKNKYPGLHKNYKVFSVLFFSKTAYRIFKSGFDGLHTDCNP